MTCVARDTPRLMVVSNAVCPDAAATCAYAKMRRCRAIQDSAAGSALLRSTS